MVDDIYFNGGVGIGTQQSTTGGKAGVTWSW
jgi:hypothetical protein